MRRIRSDLNRLFFFGIHCYKLHCNGRRRRARVNDELKVRQTRRRQTGTYLDTDRSYYGRNSRVVVSVLPWLTHAGDDGRRPAGADALLSWPCTPDQRPRPSINMLGLFLPGEPDAIAGTRMHAGPRPPAGRRAQNMTCSLWRCIRPVASHASAPVPYYDTPTPSYSTRAVWMSELPHDHLISVYMF